MVADYGSPHTPTRWVRHPGVYIFLGRVCVQGPFLTCVRGILGSRAKAPNLDRVPRMGRMCLWRLLGTIEPRAVEVSFEVKDTV